MNVAQMVWQVSTGWVETVAATCSDRPQLILAFGTRSLLARPDVMTPLRVRYPDAVVVGCTTAGEIEDVRVHDASIVATAIHFEQTTLRMATGEVLCAEDSFNVGMNLARTLDEPGLRHVLVFSDGLNVNGTALAKAFRDHLPVNVSVTGGLAGDGDRFQQTGVLINGELKEKQVVAVGLYGERLVVGYGSLGGWDPFGPQRLVTRSVGNVLYELDGECALDLYRRYLGPHASDLPGSALMFPLAIQSEGEDHSLVRTVLSINEAERSMTFAGDIPQGSHAHLMKANIDRLVDGAVGAAVEGRHCLGQNEPQLTILISCVGRKLVLKQRVEEEVDAVRDAMGRGTVIAGFYSYGEICPNGELTRCELHNQTMTITTLAES
ncbi:MAG TPA: FIST N-terminal domain-containing protein [Aquabacterium sp.]|uniref:FIST signal transduction protein n=1 Tax=Aquabacterium sp. TaxID=1872578 RepID=UPI002E344844|nr:FIST N-terminal domain-containing protein [Aquabacterium sp.]HEX5354845.1 FIST N-terminal domain-containing protein [Aquabacterium sp.]